MIQAIAALRAYALLVRDKAVDFEQQHPTKSCSLVKLLVDFGKARVPPHSHPPPNGNRVPNS